MEELVELIVRALIALFSGTGEKSAPLPPPRSVPKVPPIRTNPPAMRPQGYRPGGPVRAVNRQGAVRRVGAKLPPPMPGRFANAPPLSMPVPAKPRVAAGVEMQPPAAVAKPATTLSAGAIRQLVRSRRSAMRTIFVLSEVVGTPVGLRDL